MKTLILNSSNYVVGTTNTFIYSLPSSVNFKKSKVGIATVAVYNSSFNITSQRGNNTVNLVWNANTNVSYTFTFPSGYYSINEINAFLQSKMYENNLYCLSGTKVIYFFEIVQNSIRYSVQLNSYFLPTSANATTLGYTLPPGASWAFPTASQTPQLTFGATFGTLIGFGPQTYPATIQTTSQSKVSETTPQISTVDSYILTCNLINSRYSIPQNVFFSLPLTGALGSLITYNASSLIMSDIAPNNYNQIVIKFYDQLFNVLQMNDFDICIQLVIDDTLED